MQLVGRTVGELLELYRQFAGLASDADPSWQRLVFEGFEHEDGDAVLLFYREIEVTDGDVVEEPYVTGLHVRIAAAATTSRLIDGQVDSEPYADGDPPLLTADEFFDELSEHLVEQGLLELRTRTVTVVQEG